MSHSVTSLSEQRRHGRYAVNVHNSDEVDLLLRAVHHCWCGHLATGRWRPAGEGGHVEWMRMTSEHAVQWPPVS